MTTSRAGIDKGRLFAGHPLFGGLRPEEVERLLAYAHTLDVPAGSQIFAKGSSGTSMMAVVSGSVRISAPGEDGREIVLNTIAPGEIFGEVALLDGRPRTADAIAAANCRLLVVERRDFIPFLRDHPHVALQLLSILCERLRRTTEQVEDLLFLDVPRRLAKKLLELQRAAGAAPLAYSQRQIATMVGLSRESVNRQISAWQRAGLVAVQDGRIVLRNESGLRRVAEPED